MNKKIIYALTVIILVVIALGVYFIPVYLEKNEQKIIEKQKADNSAFINKVLEEFSSNPSIKASSAAQKVCDDMNKISVNPYNKKAPAYTFQTGCQACNSVEYDDNLNMVILTSYNKKGDLSARTVIKPPSFVTFNKEDKE